MQAFVYLFIPSSIMQVAVLSLQRPKGLEKCYSDIYTETVNNMTKRTFGAPKSQGTFMSILRRRLL